MRALRRRWEKNWPELRAALRGGLPSFVTASEPPALGDAVPAFWYHAVEAAQLDADLRFLTANGYATLVADELLGHGIEGAPTVPSVVLTFDDGAVNLYRVVYPLLRRHSMRAVAFIAPAFHAEAADNADDPHRTCTWSELREMRDSGVIDIQSHTLEHRYLPRWPEPVALSGVRPPRRAETNALAIADDLRLARERIEAELNSTVRHLAFPRFDGTADAVRLGKLAGYRGFWWGLLPGRPLNRVGDDGSAVVRLSGEFLRRLPGRGRAPLRGILWRRYAGAAARLAARG